MSDLVKQFLQTEVRNLLRETENLEDAKQYIGDILSDASEKFPEINDEMWEEMRNYVLETLLKIGRTT